MSDESSRPTEHATAKAAAIATTAQPDTPSPGAASAGGQLAQGMLARGGSSPTAYADLLRQRPGDRDEVLRLLHEHLGNRFVQSVTQLLTRPEVGSTQQIAAEGTAGASAPLPHLAAIQRAFGRHDVSHVRAAQDDAAATATAALGARAFAFGDRVAFASPPDLHTAAHEAAHVVQQRGGVAVAGGMGAAGDAYEAHADRVAAAVVSGMSAEALLDEHAGAAAGPQRAAVQCAGAERATTGKPVADAPYIDAPPGTQERSVGITLGDVVRVGVAGNANDTTLSAKVIAGAEFVQIGATAGALGTECALAGGPLFVKGLASTEAIERAQCVIELYENGNSIGTLAPRVYTSIKLPVHTWQVTYSASEDGETDEYRGMPVHGEELDLGGVMADVAALWRPTGIDVEHAGTTQLHVTAPRSANRHTMIVEGLKKHPKFKVGGEQMHLVFVPVYERFGLTCTRYTREMVNPEQGMKKDKAAELGFDGPIAFIGVNGFVGAPPEGGWGSRSNEVSPVTDAPDPELTERDRAFHLDHLASDTAHELGHLLSLPHTLTHDGKNVAPALLNNPGGSYQFSQLMSDQVLAQARMWKKENEDQAPTRRAAADQALLNSTHPKTTVGEMTTNGGTLYGPQRGGLITEQFARLAREHIITGRAFDEATEEKRRDVQYAGGTGATGPAAAAAAARGTSGTPGPLPFVDRIQAAFGRHDVTGIHAHTDAAAATGARELGARAYATGSAVAFGGTPDLHTAAHEAAHVVQQRGGVALAGGVGRANDPYEQHADAVADRVVAGQSAEALLDEHAGTGDATTAVQRKPSDVAAFTVEKTATLSAVSAALLADENVASILAEVFPGKDVTAAVFGDLIGLGGIAQCGDDADQETKVIVQRHEGARIEITVSHPFFHHMLNEIKWASDSAEPLPYLFIHKWERNTEGGGDQRGAGLKVFSRVHAAATTLGMTAMVLDAIGDPQDAHKPENGYYTWARFGFNNQLESEGDKFVDRIQTLYDGLQSIPDEIVKRDQLAGAVSGDVRGFEREALRQRVRQWKNMYSDGYRMPDEETAEVAYGEQFELVASLEDKRAELGTAVDWFVDHASEARTPHQLFTAATTKEERAMAAKIWKACGSHMQEATFDLAADSTSNQVFASYREDTGGH